MAKVFRERGGCNSDKKKNFIEFHQRMKQFAAKLEGGKLVSWTANSVVEEPSKVLKCFTRSPSLV